MDFMWRYHGSKGVPDSIVEDGVLGNLAPPGDLEESASHHLGSKEVPESLVEDGALGNMAPPADREESASHHKQSTNLTPSH